YPAIIKDHFGRLAGAHTQLVFLLAAAESLCSPFHDKGSGIVLCPGLACPGYHHGNVAAAPMGYPAFGAIDHPLIPILYSNATHIARIAAGTGLCQTPCAQGLSRGQT